MHADLVVLGYGGSYGRVAAFVRRWKTERQREQQTSGRGTFVPLVFSAGEAFQFDWSEDWAILGGKQVKLQAAHTKLSRKRGLATACYAASFAGWGGCQFHGMSSSHRVAGQSAAILAMTSAM